MPEMTHKKSEIVTQRPDLTPRKIVAELDQFIVGQNDAKRAVAVAIRNRWRRQRVPDDMKKEIGPKNMMMIGPTGVGKTEIARRLAALTGAPFIKVEATKYTEVGYYGRDVESMVRELIENAIGIVRAKERVLIEEKAKKATADRLVDLIVREIPKWDEEQATSAAGASKEKKSTAAPNDAVSAAANAACESPSDAAREMADMAKTLFPGLGALNFQITPEMAEQIQNNPNFPLPGFADFIKNLKGDSTPSGAGQGDTASSVTSAAGSAMTSASASGANSADGVSTFSDTDSVSTDPSVPLPPSAEAKKTVDRDEVRRRLEAGDYEEALVPVTTEQKTPPMMIGGIGMESMESDLQSMFENILPKKSARQELPVKEARKVIFEQESERLIDREKVNAAAVELAENLGIIFIDEIDKIVASERQSGADVSRQGVQRDLLPIVEGTTIQTKYGFVSTDHILFIAAGAFHRAKPSDLMPELQGRFPIRVELTELTEADFFRILTEPHGALTKQYAALMKTEGIDLVFEDDAIAALARHAHELNQTSQNIGARRLYTIMERLLEELSFEASEMKMGRVVVNAAYVADRLDEVAADEDLNKFIL